MSTARRPRTAPAGWLSCFASAALVLGASATVPAAAVTIDTFTTNQANVTDPPGGGSSVATAGADILGMRRGLVPDLLSGAGPVTGGVAGGVLTATVAATTPDSRGEIVVTWDGDALPLVLSPTGLGSADLTASNHSGFRFLVNSATAGSELVLEVFTDGSNASRAARRLPAVGAPTSFFLSYASDFVPFLGTGADFSDVGAIVLTVRGTESSTVIDLVETAPPSIAATKQDRTLGDVPITGPVAPGATYKYRVAITNTGTEAQTVDLADTIEPNLTIATSTIDATPALINDAYDTFGNVGESDTAPGLLANDVDPDQNGTPPALAVTAGAVATTLGGSATLAADGSFTYDPPIGVGESVDTFTYTVTDNEGNVANAVATIHIGPRIWFVDSSHGGTNQGTFANPFTSITASNLNGAGGVGDLDQPGDVIFVYAGAGAYNVGLILEADQQLIGQGSGLVLQGETIVPAGSAPTFTNGAGSGITLASNNTLMGFTVGNTTVTDIVGTSFGTLTLSNVTLNGNGGALDLTTGTLAATFNSIASTNAPARGVNLDAATGSLTVTGGTSITDSAQAGIRVVNGGSTYNFGATTLSSTGSGLDLQTNATSTFTFSSLAVTTDAGPGLFAANSGTLNIGGSGNTIAATGGAAVDITSTSLGAGATFSTLSSTNSTGKGVNLDTVTGAFTANGGAIGNSSGVCFDVNGGSSNITFAGTVSCTAANRLVEITGRTGGTVTISGNLSGTGSSTGINIANNSVSGSPVINFTGASKVLNTGANAAVTLDNNDVATINFTGGGLDIDTTSGAGFRAINGAAGISVQGAVNSITSTAGTALEITSSTIAAGDVTFQSIASNGGSNGIVLNGTGSTGNLVVTGTGSAGSGGTIQNKAIGISLTSTTAPSFAWMQLNDFGDWGIRGHNVDGFTLANSTVTSATKNGNDAAVDEGSIYFGTENPGGINGLTGVVSVTNCVIEDGFENNFKIANLSGNLSQFTMTNTTIRDTSTVSPGNNGLEFRLQGSASLTADITNSTFTGNRANGVQVSATPDWTGTADVEIGAVGVGGSGGTFTNNNIGVNIANGGSGTMNFDVQQGTFNSSPGLASPININLAAGSGGPLSGSVLNNVITNANSATGPGIRVTSNGTDGDGSNVLTIRIAGNNISQIGNRGIEVIARDGNSRINATITGNTVSLTDPLSADGIRADAGAVSTDTTTICADITGNTSTTVAGVFGIRVRQRFAGTTYILEDYAGGPTDNAAVQTFLSTNNNGASTSADHAGTGFGTIADCPTP